MSFSEFMVVTPEEFVKNGHKLRVMQRLTQFASYSQLSKLTQLLSDAKVSKINKKYSVKYKKKTLSILPRPIRLNKKRELYIFI